MRIGCLLPFLAVAAFLSGCGAAPRVQDITILSVHRGWGDRSNSLKVTKHQGSYWAAGRQIPPELVSDLVSAAAAKAIPQPDLENLGVTEDWLARAGLRALASFEKDRQTTLNPADRKWFLANFRNKQLVQQAIVTGSVPATEDIYSEMVVNIALETGERWRLYSNSPMSYRIPWTVHRGGYSFDTYDSRLGRCLGGIVPPGFANGERLNDPRPLVEDVAYYVTKNSEVLLIRRNQ